MSNTNGTAMVKTPQQEIAELRAKVARQEAELAAVKAKPPVSELRLQVSAKGAVSVYGMGRWPVTLYAEQWERILGKSAEIKAFIAANKAKLSFKHEPEEAPVGGTF